MELRHLRYFRAVAEEQSFTLAARRLHVSQSGVSGQVRDLERELGVALFRRTKRSVSLTRQGLAFLPEAIEILDRADRAVEIVRRATSGRSGKLNVGLRGPATAPFLPRLIREFRKMEPGVSLGLKDLDPAHQPEALVNGDIDVGFTRGIPAPLRRTLTSEVFFREPLVAILPQGHSIAEQDSVSMKDLAGECFVLYARENAPELFDAIVSLCKRAGFSPDIVDTPRLWHSVLTMIEAGEGLSVVPASVGHLQTQGVVVRPLSDRGCIVDVVLAWKAAGADPVRQSFLDLLHTHQAEIRRMFGDPAAALFTPSTLKSFLTAHAHQRSCLLRQCLLHLRVGDFQVFRMHPRLANRRHEIRIAKPPRQRVQMQVPGNTRSGSSSQVHSQIHAIGLVIDGKRRLHSLRQAHHLAHAFRIQKFQLRYVRVRHDHHVSRRIRKPVEDHEHLLSAIHQQRCFIVRALHGLAKKTVRRWPSGHFRHIRETPRRP